MKEYRIQKQDSKEVVSSSKYMYIYSKSRRKQIEKGIF